MPSAADAATAASARYGLASAPGRRHSNRQRSGRGERMARTAQERFSYPHVALIGANHPGTRRLYELMVGLSRSEAAGRWSSTPAMAEPSGDGKSSAGEAPANAFASPLQQDRWMCPLDPSSPGLVLARKLARSPIEAASC